MPRNFDEMIEADLTFVVSGETFTARYVRPEVLARWEDEVLAIDDKDEAERKQEQTAEAAIARLDRRIEDFLVPDDVDRWRTLRAREDRAVPYVVLRELVKWLVEVNSNRPTETPSPSGRGRGRTEA